MATTTTLADEFLTFKKLLYKSENQHRNAKYFKAAKMLRASLSRLMRSSVVEKPVAVARLVACKKWSDISGFLPVYEGLSDYVHTLERCVTRSTHAARHFTSLVCTRYFLSFGVVMLSCISRMGLLLREMYTLARPDMQEISLLLLSRTREVCRDLPDRDARAVKVVGKITRALRSLKRHESGTAPGSLIIKPPLNDDDDDDDLGEIVRMRDEGANV